MKFKKSFSVGQLLNFANASVASGNTFQIFHAVAFDTWAKKETWSHPVNAKKNLKPVRFTGSKIISCMGR